MTAESALAPRIDDEQIADILKGMTVPSPPQILADLQMELLLPDPDLPAMAGMIARDVGLAGSILKTVNSPLFGLRHKVASIDHAVNLLGIDTVLSIVNAYFLRNEAINDSLSREEVAIMTRFWDSAMDVATCCALVARQILFPHPEQAYLLGLFHNAGIPLLSQKFGDYPAVQVAAYAQPEGRVTLVENERLHTSHQVMSYYVAKTWQLPAALCTIIRSHHNLERLESEGDERDELLHLASILKLAEHIVGLHRVLGDQAEDNEWRSIGDQVLAELGLSASDLEDLCNLAADQGIGRQSYYM